MKKIVGIITFHRAHNYGAMLQAYALCQVIKKMNLRCEIIDYHCEAIDGFYKKESVIDTLSRTDFLKALQVVYDRVKRGYYFDFSYYKFKKFLKNELPISNNSYINSHQLNNLPYYAYILGSDQIWNKEITKGYDKVYFGTFIPEGKKKIAYAASVGNGYLDENDERFFKKQLQSFDFIGVREKQLKTEIEALGYNGVECTLDPTLLLDPAEWQKFIRNKQMSQGKYILIYMAQSDKNVYKSAKKLSRRLGYPLIEITYKYDYTIKDIKQVKSCGPKEFLTLFYYSEFIITNSFHGTCFSIIFEKNFYFIPLKGSEGRVTSLLSLLGLENRRAATFKEININDNIDYEIISQKLNQERSRSQRFLETYLLKKS